MFPVSIDTPLADRMRPKTLNDIIGQEKLVGEQGLIRRFIEQKSIPSMILWGSPGVGKTTLAEVIAKELGSKFHQINAITSGVKDLKEIIDKAKKEGTIILFIDEIHRFNKTQQNVLLQAVEKGWITLIGATTENPSFEVITALLSRCQVFILDALSDENLKMIIQNALDNDEWLSQKKIKIREWDSLLIHAGGDGRKALNVLELVCKFSNEEFITNAIVNNILQQNILSFDKDGEDHYNTISAFIKSVRGSDPNAAVYYLARMLASGEKPEFIARRLIILAAEDIGLANPNALLLANAGFDSVHKIGMPEARIILSQVTIYLATSPKSNSAYVAIDKALSELKKSGSAPIPLHLRNPVTMLMKNIDYGKGYQYAHDYENNFVDIEFMPKTLQDKKFYEPSQNTKENEIRKFLKIRWIDKYEY